MKKRTWFLIGILILIIMITNPGMIPFIPLKVKMQLLTAMNNLFGDVSQVTDVIMLNWITLFQLCLMLITVFILYDVVNLVMQHVKTEKKRLKTMLSLYSSLAKYLFTIVAIIWGLNIIGISSGTIFAGVSIITMVISFSADSLIADVITGVLRIFDNSYNVDDIIEVDGYKGTITETGIRTTSVQDEYGNIKIINNADMRNIINRSRMQSKVVCDIEVSNRYKLNEIEGIILKAKNSIVTKHYAVTEPRYRGIQEIKKDSVILRLEAYADEKNINSMQMAMNREILAQLQENGIKNDNAK